MTTQVITSFSPAGAKAYGLRGVKAYRRYSPWPLLVYLDAPAHIDGVTVRSTATIPGWSETRSRLPMRREDANRPDRYTWHAQRFAVKPFVWWDAAVTLGEGVLLWLDGDTEAIAPVPKSLAVRLLDTADVAFLGRQRMHPETGCVVFRIPHAVPFLEWCKDAYQTGLFRTWADGWTDCHCLRHGIHATGIAAHDLTSQSYIGKSHIWPASPLAPYFRHYKGKLKRVAVPC